MNSANSGPDNSRPCGGTAENRFECWCVDCRDSVRWENPEAYEATMDKRFPLDYFAGGV